MDLRNPPGPLASPRYPSGGKGGGGLLFAAVLGLLLALPARAPAEERDEWMTLPDGVELRTLVLLPDGDPGPFPALFLRTPYESDYPSLLGMATGFGYAVVVQYTRGFGGSGGEPEAFRTDREDGQAALRWLLDQPWCNGRVAMGGGSALAIPAYLMAPGADPRMECQLLAIATPDVYDHAAFQGGAFKTRDVEAWLSWVGAGHLLSLLESHRTCDAWWDPIRVHPAQGVDVRAAGVHVGGWWDVFTEGTIAGFHAWRRSADPTVAARQKLVMGPFDHHHIGEPVAGNRTFPENARFDLVATLLSYVQWCFDGYNDEIDSWPPVRYYLMGSDEPGAPGNEWRGAADWPPPSRDLALRLHGAGILAEGAPTETLPLEVSLDPARPSPTVGGRNLVGDTGPRDQAPKVESRDDAHLFTSAALDAPLEVAGRLRATLTVVPVDADADVAVRVTDVYPDGRSLLVTDGIQRLSARAGCEALVAVEPGVAVDVDVDLWSTAHVFAAGHQIRVVVTGANHPRYELNPVLVARGAGPAFTLATGPAAASALHLPVLLPDVPVPEVAEVAEVAEAAEVVEGAEVAGDVPADVPGPDGAPADAPDVATTDATSDIAADVPGPPDEAMADDGPAAPDREADAATGDETHGEGTADMAGPDAGMPPSKSGGGCMVVAGTAAGPAWALAAVVMVLGLARRRRRAPGLHP